MVIHHFNRIIKNKWVWGVFAVLISAFFAFDFIFDGRGDSRGFDGAGKLDGETVKPFYLFTSAPSKGTCQPWGLPTQLICRG